MAIQPIKPFELVVIGDRVFTDVILGNKLGALSIWTTGLWERELMPMRYLEYGAVGLMNSWIKFASSPRWKHNRPQPGEPDRPVSKTPQELFVRPPKAGPAPEPSRLIQALNLAVTGIQVSYRGARTGIEWGVARYRLRQEQKALVPAEDPTGTRLPAPSQPLHLRVLNAGCRGAAIIGLWFASLTRLATKKLIGESRFRTISKNLHQLSSKIGIYGRRLQKSWPQSSH